jgi:hypothetical protein
MQCPGRGFARIEAMQKRRGFEIREKKYYPRVFFTVFIVEGKVASPLKTDRNGEWLVKGNNRGPTKGVPAFVANKALVSEV